MPTGPERLSASLRPAFVSMLTFCPGHTTRHPPSAESSSHRVEQRRDGLHARRRVDEAKAHARLAAPRRRLRERDLLAEHPIRPRQVLHLRPSRPPEQDDRQRRLRDELEVRAPADLLRRRPGHVQNRLHGLPVGTRAVRREGEPEGEAAHATGEVVGVVRRRPFARGVDVLEVLGLLSERRRGKAWIAVEDRGAVERREQPLVRVDHDRVGPLDPVEQRPDGGGGESRAAVRAVDVQPDAEPPADLGDAGEIVDVAAVRRAAGRGDGEDAVEVLAVQRRLQRLPRQPPALVVWNGKHVDVHDASRRPDR